MRSLSDLADKSKASRKSSEKTVLKWFEGKFLLCSVVYEKEVRKLKNRVIVLYPS